MRSFHQLCCVMLQHSAFQDGEQVFVSCPLYPDTGMVTLEGVGHS